MIKDEKISEKKLISDFIHRKFLRKKGVSELLIFLLFMVLPVIFFAFNINIFTAAIALGDGEQYGLPMKKFTKNLILWNFI